MNTSIFDSESNSVYSTPDFSHTGFSTPNDSLKSSPDTSPDTSPESDVTLPSTPINVPIWSNPTSPTTSPYSPQTDNSSTTDVLTSTNLQLSCLDFPTHKTPHIPSLPPAPLDTSSPVHDHTTPKTSPTFGIQHGRSGSWLLNFFRRHYNRSKSLEKESKRTVDELRNDLELAKKYVKDVETEYGKLLSSANLALINTVAYKQETIVIRSYADLLSKDISRLECDVNELKKSLKISNKKRSVILHENNELRDSLNAFVPKHDDNIKASTTKNNCDEGKVSDFTKLSSSMIAETKNNNFSNNEGDSVTLDDQLSPLNSVTKKITFGNVEELSTNLTSSWKERLAEYEFINSHQSKVIASLQLELEACGQLITNSSPDKFAAVNAQYASVHSKLLVENIRHSTELFRDNCRLASAGTLIFLYLSVCCYY